MGGEGVHEGSLVQQTPADARTQVVSVKIAQVGIQRPTVTSVLRLALEVFGNHRPAPRSARADATTHRSAKQLSLQTDAFVMCVSDDHCSLHVILFCNAQLMNSTSSLKMASARRNSLPHLL